MITNIRESDHGSYQCRAENEVESLDAVAELIVQGNICSVRDHSYALVNKARNFIRLLSPQFHRNL